ncbi:hypothetical protein BGZ88_011656 [Linnemannia elongata]|nr:hypothetical protein BGZ88_011656 [Linnemannia elongata]
MSERKLPMDKSERLLNELLKIPVNTICCDCGAANPNWASYSLGCFLCVRCCSVHRKMGTHISKVKSVSLDSWTQDDIDTMKNWGNGKVNALYMPHPERHPPPISMEGSAMEQYIRSKYERKEYMEGGGNYQPSGRSAYGNTFSGGRGTGSRNDVVNTNSYTTQMSALRAMGFKDNAKNLQVLQSTDGDVPNAIEILCRIGQGPVSSTPNTSSNNNTSKTYSRPSPSSNNNSSNNNNNASRDPKEAILWNMGFHDSALNKEALRRAGGNPEVAAALLIDEKDKLAKAVREKGGSSSPLPARLEPPGVKKTQKNEDLLLDLSTDDDQQQQQQRMMMQQQMQMQNAFGNNNQQWNQQTPGLDQFGQNQNQLQSILDKNAQILALYSNETNNNNNNNNMFGNSGMNNAFGLQQQQTGFNNDTNSWAMNNNNINNNQQMNSAFGIQTSMATGANNMFGNTNSSMGMGMGNMGTMGNMGGMGNMGSMGMNSLQQQQLQQQQQQQQQQQMSPFGVSQASQQPTGNAFGNNMFSSNTNNNQFAGMGGNTGGGLGSPFNSLTATTNTNTNTFGSMNSNPMGNMGMNANNNGMNGGFGAGSNSPFGMNNNNNNSFNNNNPNPWGNNNNNLF